MPIKASLIVDTPTDPVVPSYKALRKAVGYVAVALPFVLSISYYFRHDHHIVQGSISAYYYTGLRDVFVGSLCAIAMFMLCARGYSRKDEIAGMLSAFCALGVAFFPMSPKDIKVHLPCIMWPLYPPLHFVFATTLFATLGYFCIFLFRLSDGKITPQKLQRNRIYVTCGWIIYISMALEGLLGLVQKSVPAMQTYWENGHHLLICETLCLLAFGYAWLVKGEAFFADVPPQPSHSIPTDKLEP